MPKAPLGIIVVALVLVAGVVGACSDGGGNTKAFCNAVRSGDNPLDVFTAYDPRDPAAARQQLQRGVQRLEDLERAAPPNLRAKVGTLVGVAQQLAVALDPANSSGPPPDLSANSGRVRDASAAVTGYAATNCGVQLESSAPPG